MTVLIKPIISEKAGMLSSKGKYVFQVAATTTASEVKKEVEKVYKVKVASVNTILTKGKLRRSGKTVKRTASKKKAVVTLVPGHTIEGITEPV